MNIQKAAKQNPKTTILTIVAVITALWNQLSENAELFGVPSKTIMIGSVILAAVAMVVNMLTNNEN